MRAADAMATASGGAGAVEAAESSPADVDRGLVEAFRRGDRRAFEALVRRHQRPVWALVFRFARDRDAAEDLAQRAFIQALERISELRGPFRPWLMRIAVNLAKNAIRDGAKFVRDDDDAAQPASTPADQVDQALDEGRRARRVREALKSLSERQREVVQLRVDAQLAFAEVGEALGITENNAKVTYHHAVRRLRALLGADDAAL